MTRTRTGRALRGAFTLVELVVSVVVTAIVAASVVTTMSAVRIGLEGQDEAARATARIARAQARVADHLFRARMSLEQEGGFCALWVPSEEFDSSPTNAAEYDAIHREELRFWTFDAAAQAVVAERTSDRADRAQLGLSTDWRSLRDSTSTGAAGGCPPSPNCRRWSTRRWRARGLPLTRHGFQALLLVISGRLPPTTSALIGSFLSNSLGPAGG